MWLLVPTLAIDTEYRCVVLAWLNVSIYIGNMANRNND